MMTMMKAPSLVDLCVQMAVKNVRYPGDLGETDLHLLDRILPHYTVDQLKHIGDSTEENKIGMCAFAQRFHRQAINKAFTERDLVTVFLTQSNIMKKGKVQFLNSHEMKNVAAMKKNRLQQSNGLSSIRKPGVFSGNYFASTSKSTGGRL
ncbi:uncharacterized protein LOC130774304 [Actinidia eriantha]|uniref:uncharacterized protein LOC130774304 n=1 Tax=Actinidia eriantha TaxID=165200 RepID=UPI002583010C|nr:uncharacterized protein LOC130774304 [Actinidia eriantha]